MTQGVITSSNNIMINVLSPSDMQQHKIALDERFRILRFVYGLSTDSVNSINNNNPNSLQEGTPISIHQV